MSEYNGKLPLMAEDLDIISKLPDEPDNEPTEEFPNGMSADDFKAKFDAAAKLIKAFLNERLVPAITAENVPFTPSNVINAENVQAAIELIQKSIGDVQSGQLGPGAVKKDNLDEDVWNKIIGTTPIVSHEEPAAENNYDTGKVWIQTKDGTSTEVSALWVQSGVGKWFRYGFDVLSVERGGTGKREFSNGGLLYGAEGRIAQTANPSVGDAYLAYENGKPVWKEASGIGDLITRIKVKSGSYDGTGKPREVSLDITPVLVIITNQTKALVNTGSGSFHDAVYVLAQGQEQNRLTGSNTTNSSSSDYLEDSVTLSDDKLQFKGKKGGREDNSSAKCANAYGCTYDWVAVY